MAGLSKHGYWGPDDKCLLQSIELTTMNQLKGRTHVKRVFLLKRVAKTSRENLQRIKDADVFSICLDKELILPLDSVQFFDHLHILPSLAHNNYLCS